MVAFPPSELLSAPHNQTHVRPATVPTGVTREQLFNLTSGVAADMVVDRELVSVSNYSVASFTVVCIHNVLLW